MVKWGTRLVLNLENLEKLDVVLCQALFDKSHQKEWNDTTLEMKDVSTSLAKVISRDESPSKVTKEEGTFGADIAWMLRATCWHDCW